MKPFLEHSLEKGLKLLENGSLSHIITSHYGVPLMVANGGGLLVEVTDGIGYELRDFNFYYDLEKALNIRLAQSLAVHLRQHKIAVVALTPGFLRSEEMLAHFGVGEDKLARRHPAGQVLRLFRDAVLHRQGGGRPGMRPEDHAEKRAVAGLGQAGGANMGSTTWMAASRSGTIRFGWQISKLWNKFKFYCAL